MPGRFEFSRDSDLTGFWSGEYWYDVSVDPTPFSAHIEDTAGGLNGTTLEPATFGASGSGELSADITGVRSGSTVLFTKVYHPARGVHRDPIAYSGIADDKFTRIEGEWRFSYGFSGRFLMYRASFGLKAEEKQEVAVKKRQDRRVVVEVRQRKSVRSG